MMVMMTFFDLPTVIGWSLDEQSRTMKMTYQNEEEDSLTMDEVLNTHRLRLLEQLCDLAPSHVVTPRIMIMFKSRMRVRANQLMALYAIDLDDDEFEESDVQSDGYISDVIPSAEEY
ncbi:hypothetical protein Hanom_Chr06g00494981 [Helianthus anomalus]